MKKPQTPHEILRLAYTIAAMGFMSAAVLFVSTYTHYANEVRARDRMQRYHVRSLMLTEEIQQDLSRLQAMFTPATGNTESGHQRDRRIATSNRVTGIALDSISEALKSIAALQTQYGDECFVGTVQRAQDRHDRMRQGLRAEISSHEGCADRLSAFALTIHQLERLHSIFMEDGFREFTITGKKRARNFTVAASIIFVVTGVIMIRLLILLRRKLRGHLQTEKSLLAHEQKLQQTQKMDALGTLVGGIAHDFNNILTAILGQTEALLAGATSGDPQYSGLREIQKAGERAAGLTRQLLAFSRNDVVKLQPIHLNLLVRDMEQILRRLIPENISLVVECGECLGTVRGDPVQLEQIMLNLVVNSRDAMPRGGRLTIRTTVVEINNQMAANLNISPGAYCRLCVDDEGCGMTPEIRARVFEPFFTTKGLGKGTGLGLSTVHGIVTSSSGFILVESEVDQGTKFEIYLPRYDEQVTKGDGATTSDGLGLAQDGHGTVLLVEDQQQVRDLVAKSLTDVGYEILAAADGSETLRMCREHAGSIDLILADVIMPGISGPELVRQVRTLFPDIAVVYMSGYTDESKLREVTESGWPLVSKPFKLQDLIRIIRGQLDARPARAARKRA